MSEIIGFILDFSIPLGVILAASLAFACYLDSKPHAPAVRRVRRF